MRNAIKPTWNGEKLAKLRKAAGISQKEFSASIGVKQVTFSAWECNRSTPNLGAVAAICNKLNCDVSDLLPDASISVSGSVSQSVVATAPVSNVRIGNADGDGREVAALKAEVARLSALVESQQRTIEALTRGRR